MSASLLAAAHSARQRERLDRKGSARAARAGGVPRRARAGAQRSRALCTRPSRTAAPRAAEGARARSSRATGTNGGVSKSTGRASDSTAEDQRRRGTELIHPTRAVHSRCRVLGRVDSAAIDAPCVLASHAPIAPRQRVVIQVEVLKAADARVRRFSRAEPPANSQVLAWHL